MEVLGRDLQSGVSKVVPGAFEAERIKPFFFPLVLIIKLFIDHLNSSQHASSGIPSGREVAAQRETKYHTMLSRLPHHGIVISLHYSFHHLLKKMNIGSDSQLGKIVLHDHPGCELCEKMGPRGDKRNARLDHR